MINLNDNMPNVEEISNLLAKKLPDTIEGETKYSPNKDYWIFYDTGDNNLIVGIFGMPIYIQELEIPNNERINATRIVNMSEDDHELIVAACNSLALLAFYDQENKTFKYRRLFLGLDDTTKYCEVREALISKTNTLKFRLFVLDEHEQPAKVVKELSVKNLRKKDGNNIPSECELNGIHSSKNRKLVIENGGFVEIKLLSEGSHNIRFKATIPESDIGWLALFVNAIKLTDEEISTFDIK